MKSPGSEGEGVRRLSAWCPILWSADSWSFKKVGSRKTDKERLKPRLPILDWKDFRRSRKRCRRILRTMKFVLLLPICAVAAAATKPWLRRRNQGAGDARSGARGRE